MTIVLDASPHVMHETLNAVGDAATLERVLPDAGEIARGLETARAGARRRPVLVVACDGAHAPTRPPGGRTTKRGPGTWREAKGFRLYLLGPEDRVIHVASWHQIADKAELSRALGVVQQLEQSAQTRWVSPYMLGGLRAAVGHYERAIDDLQAAYDDRVGMMLFLQRDPVMDPVRQHPRIQGLIQQIARQSNPK